MGKFFWFLLGTFVLLVFLYVANLPSEEPLEKLPFEPFEMLSFQGIRLSPDQVDELWFYYPENIEDAPRTIRGLAEKLLESDKELLFATNGGIFSPNYQPLGLYVEAGRPFFPLNQAEGEGNFFLKPNGVFWIEEGQAGVQRTEDYDELRTPDYALQSGPMLVLEGELHPAFNPESENKFIRSGVGVTASGEVVFVISKQPITFYDFAMIFKSDLGAENALYLDGAISEMFIEGVQEEGFFQEFSMIVGIWK